MKTIPINKDVIRQRLSYIEESTKSLERFKEICLDEFNSNPDNFRIAFYDLHRALEATFDIGSHILSRIPGARATSYKEIAKLLGKHKIINHTFANRQLTKMAGYRNRMVHFYSEITSEEIYNIIQNELGDFDNFCIYVNAILNNPENVGLKINT